MSVFNNKFKTPWGETFIVQSQRLEEKLRNNFELRKQLAEFSLFLRNQGLTLEDIKVCSTNQVKDVAESPKDAMHRDFDRYIVFKRKDVDKFFNTTETIALSKLARKLDDKRAEEHREPLECVVVEHDWPMYEEVWGLIEDWERDTAYEKELESGELSK